MTISETAVPVAAARPLRDVRGFWRVLLAVIAPLALLVPAAFAVAWVSRRGAPRLATAGALVALGGLCAGFGILPGVPQPAHISITQGLDPVAMGRLQAALENDPLVLVGGLLFILGITVGLLLL